MSELDAFKINGNFNLVNNNNTASVNNSNHHFLNPARPNISSSINTDYKSTLSVGTLRSDNNNNHDFLHKLRANNNDIHVSNINNYRSDEQPISSRSEAFNQDIFKHPNPKNSKFNILDNIEN